MKAFPSGLEFPNQSQMHKRAGVEECGVWAFNLQHWYSTLQ
jgi:hypothetical protein